MKIWVSEYTAQIDAPAHTLTNLFKFVFSHTYQFTSFGQDVFDGASWWKSKGVRFDEARFGITQQVESLDLQIDNVDNWFSDLCLSESITGSEVYIYQAALDNNLAVIATDLIFFGYADRRSFNQQRAKLTLKNHMSHWKTLSPDLHSAACRSIFKDAASQVIGTDTNNYTCIIDHPGVAANRPITGAEYASFWVAGGSSGIAWVSGSDYKAGTCRYAGVGVSCDQSWEQCTIYSNTANFSGNRWLPYYEDKVIWWGRVPRNEGPK